LILFKDWRDRTIWHIDLRDLVHIAERDLRSALHRWFAGADFKRLIKEASYA
jgi:hypothetical protein